MSVLLFALSLRRKGTARPGASRRDFDTAGSEG